MRKTKGITQKEITLKLYMDERTYSKIERGEKKSFDIRLLSAIADILETDIARLPGPAEQNPVQAKSGTAPDLSGHMHELRQTQAEIIEKMKLMEARIMHLLYSVTRKEPATA